MGIKLAEGLNLSKKESYRTKTDIVKVKYQKDFWT